MVLPPRRYHHHELFSTQASAKYYAREFGQLPPCSLPKHSQTVTGSDSGYSSKGSSVLSQYQLAMVLLPRHEHEFEPFDTQGDYIELPAQCSLSRYTCSGTDSGYSSQAVSQQLLFVPTPIAKPTNTPAQSKLLYDKLSNLQTKTLERLSRDKSTQNNYSSNFTRSHSRFCSSRSDNREHDDYGHVKVAKEKVANGW